MNLRETINLRRFMKPVSIACLALALLAGCGENKTTAPNPNVAHKHEHKPPHGGAPVVLGDEEYHVELVLDAPAGKLDAYVFDGELENFTRVTAASFDVTAKLPGRDEVLSFKAVPNNATGEKIGDTALFEAQADWLKTATTFDAVLKELTVKGKSYQNVAFNFPKGNDRDESK
jgi:hypothetical protein